MDTCVYCHLFVCIYLYIFITVILVIHYETQKLILSGCNFVALKIQNVQPNENPRNNRFPLPGVNIAFVFVELLFPVRSADNLIDVPKRV